MPTQTEIDRGRGLMIGGYLDGRKIVGGQLYQREQSDYPTYIQKLKAGFTAYLTKIKESIPVQMDDKSPHIKANDLVEPAYRMFYATIKDYNWEKKLAYAVAIYKLVGEKTMGNVAFDDYLKLVYSYLMSRALPRPETATFADGVFVAHQIIADKLEFLSTESIGKNTLASYAKALLAEVSEEGYVPDDLQRQSPLFSRYGIGYDLMFVHVNPFELYEMLWDEPAQ